MSRHRRGLGAIFRVPALIAIVTVAGLILALLGDGWRDALSWAALALPVGTALVFALFRGRKGR